MTVYAITDTKKGRTGIAPTYLQTTPKMVYCRSLHFEFLTKDSTVKTQSINGLLSIAAWNAGLNKHSKIIK